MGSAQKKLAITLIILSIIIQIAYAQIEVIQANNTSNFEIIPYQPENSENFIVNTYTISHDFIMWSNNAQINVCECSVFVDQLFIRNTGSITQTYLLSEDSRYSTLTANSVTLNPGETARILNYIEPGCNEFSDDISIAVQAQSSGIQKEIRQDLNSLLCDNINATARQLNFTANPCTLVTTQFNVTNPLDFSEEYKFETDVLPEYTIFSEEKVIINPRQTKTIIAYTYPTCDVYGKFEGRIKISTENTEIEKELPLSILINRKYDYDITFPQGTESCNYIKTRIPITIRNKENLTNNYTLSIQKSKWFSLETNYVELLPYEQKTVYIDVQPKWKETSPTEIYLKAKSKYGNIEKNYTIVTYVNNCYDSNITLSSGSTACFDDREIEFTLQNTGNKRTEFEITGSKELLIYRKTYDLAPGDRVAIKALPNVSDADRKYSFTVKSSAINGTFASKHDFSLDVKSMGTCYKAKIDTPLYTSYNYSGKEKNITITNIGLKRAEYNLSVEYPSFAELSSKRLVLDPYENRTIKIRFIPESDRHVGIYPVKINAVEEKGMLYHSFFMSRLYEKPFLQKASESIRHDVSWAMQNWKLVLKTLLIIIGVFLILAAIFWLTVLYFKKQDSKKKLVVRVPRKRKSRK